MAQKNKIIHTYVVLAFKESPYLEECVKSTLNQKYKSKVVIATSTPNAYIDDIAERYNLEVFARPLKDRAQGAASDFNYALTTSKTELSTIVNHDEIYNYDYSFEVVRYYEKNKDTSIIFTKYYDIKDEETVYKSLNFTIKSILLWPLAISNKNVFTKRLALRFGNPIGCPATTFVTGHFKQPVFAPELKASFDYWAWEKLSREKYAFGYVKKPLMGHRIHSESITSGALQDNVRIKEDIIVFSKFWPRPVAILLSKFYKFSERSND
jgi:glycosyltransferase involved in cell wall biosynthesis